MSRVSLSTVTLDLVRENQADLGEEIAALLRERRLLALFPNPHLHFICLSPPQSTWTLTPEMPSCQTLWVNGLGLPEKDIVGDLA